jgi:predicted Zn finger-like uncharacterized protein
LITQCPNCETTFRVTGAILRAARGQVRCGRCQTQFDAVERLVDEENGEDEEEAIEGNGREAAAEGQDDIVVEERAAEEDITLEGKRIEITGTYRVPSFVNQGSDTEESTQIVEEYSVMEADAGDSEGEVDEAPTESIESTSLTDPNEYDLRAEAAAADIDVNAIGIGATSTERAKTRKARFASLRRRVTAQDPAAELDLLTAQGKGSTDAPVWTWVAAPLVLLLVLQIVHHYRNDLAVSPRFGSAITRVYGALHLSLSPHWQLSSYEVRQWGVIMDPASPGTLKVRASIRNTAKFSQPLPLLKLVLENRWGEEVRMRAFEPQEYLETAQSKADLHSLAPNQLANAILSIADPGTDAEGFRFDVCLPHGTEVQCAENRG